MFNKLFLTKENISKYNKLYPYNLSKYLPSINDIPNLKFSTSAIVGNGTIHLEHKLGSDIDKKGIVIRMNRHFVKNYEEYVGFKTTLHFVNYPSIKKQNVVETSQSKIIIFLDPAGKYQMYDLYKKYGYNYDNKLLLLIKPNIHYFIKSTFHNSLKKHIRISHPTMGWYISNIIMNLCDEIYLYGFNLTGGCGHYYYKEFNLNNPGDPCISKGICRFGSESCSGKIKLKGNKTYHSIDIEYVLYLIYKFKKNKKIFFPQLEKKELEDVKNKLWKKNIKFINV